MRYITFLFLIVALIALGACSGAKTTPAPSGEADTYVAKAGETIKVKVSTSFDPKAIKVKKGEAVKMEFTRLDDKNCGDEVVFPKLGITKPLPVGQAVLVEFTPTESGDLQFNCGMEMMKGKVIVE